MLDTMPETLTAWLSSRKEEPRRFWTDRVVNAETKAEYVRKDIHNAGGWLPIETAPKDGTPFAAVGIVGQRIDPWHTVYTCCWSEEDRLFAAWVCPDWLHIDATHWMPLPPCPH